MADKFQNKYRIASSRLPNWDYGSNAVYFVTICTHNRYFYFGKISDGNIQLSETGKIAMQCWIEIPNHFPFVELDEFVVMPDHVHGIVFINKSRNRNNDNDRRDAINRSTNTNTPTKILNDIESELKPSIEKTGGFAGSKNPMLNDNLSRIIRWYKGRVSFETRKINQKFAWQPRFYDRIIRDEIAYHQILIYIQNNPLNWRETNLLY